MTRIAIAGAVAASAAIIMVATYAGDGIDALSAASAPKLPPPECGEGVSYDGPTIPPGIARASNAMALDMYRHLSADPAGAESNHIFSPLAVYMAASLLYEGARGETADQLRGALALDPSEGTRRLAAAHTASALRGDDPCILLDMSNALWIDRNIAVPDAVFAAVARDVYDAEVRAVDFGDPADGADRIDRWAWRETHGRVEDVDGGLPGSNAVLSSVARFGGPWLYQFSPAGTGQFIRPDGTAVDAEFMWATAYFERYGVGNIEPTVLQRIIIPYGGERLSMLAVMPPEADGLPGLATSITPEILEGWMNYPDPYVSRQTKLKMPAFEIRAGYTLSDMLAGTGAAGALAPGAANLSGIGTSAAAAAGPAMALATHDAFLGVDGKGTDAHPGWGRDLLPLWITLDRPFLFFIYEEESDAILLMGSFSDPSAAG